MSRIPALTSLRFIAAAVVFLHHYMCHHGYVHFGGRHFGDFEQSTIAVLLYEGRYGVTLFFVLSGFLLLVRYYDSIFTKTSFRIYWLKRFARIFPLYWFLLLVMYVYYVVHNRSTEHFLVFGTLTQGFFSRLKFEGIGTAWSLTVEECFYLMLPFLILGLRWWWPGPGFTWRKMTGAIVAGVALYFLMYDLGGRLQERNAWEYGGFLGSTNDLRVYTIFGRIGDFAIGMLFGLVYLKSRNSLLEKRWVADGVIAASTVAILVVCYLIYFEGGNGPAFDNLEQKDGWKLNTLNAFFSGAIIYFVCAPRSIIARGLSWRPFVYLGEISYAFYLIHYNHISFRLYGFTRANEWGFFTSVIFLYLVISLASALCYELVERPAQHLILEKAGVLRRTVRRPTLLRLLGMRRHACPEKAARRERRRPQRAVLLAE